MSQPAGERSEAGDLTAQDRLLIEFLSANDAACPICGYNVRGLQRPVCPECRRDLHLTVGVGDVPMRWFIAAIAPGLFSGIAAILLAIPMIFVPLTGGGRPPGFLYATDAFGFVSGLFALGLILRRGRFTSMEASHQYWLAAAIWAVHIFMFFVFLGFTLGFY